MTEPRVSVSVDCPKCLKSRWHATGRFNHNRHGLRRAECVCEFCGYAFSSGRPIAIEAGERIVAENGGTAPVDPPLVRVPQPTLPHTSIPRALASVGSLAKDWKQKQSGGDE